MAERINKVIRVLDRNYGAALSRVPMDGHVWLIESPANREAAASYRALQPESNVEIGVTTFKAGDEDTGSEACLKILETIDLHHGEYSSDPPYAVLEIVGAPLSRSVKKAIEALGFSKFESTGRGFTALR
jgi:hypothetical protein